MTITSPILVDQNSQSHVTQTSSMHYCSLIASTGKTIQKTQDTPRIVAPCVSKYQVLRSVLKVLQISPSATFEKLGFTKSARAHSTTGMLRRQTARAEAAIAKVRIRYAV